MSPVPQSLRVHLALYYSTVDYGSTLTCVVLTGVAPSVMVDMIKKDDAFSRCAVRFT